MSDSVKKMWTVKSPSGRLSVSSTRENRTEAIEDFVLFLLKTGVMVERPEWHGLSYFSKCWRVLRCHGYRAVKVSISMCSDPRGGFRWPELTEVES